MTFSEISILTALEMINTSLFKSPSNKDIKLVRDFIKSIEDEVDEHIVYELNDLVNNIIKYK